jgi:Cdc6-like AAA superfamily ATPase
MADSLIAVADDEQRASFERIGARLKLLNKTFTPMRPVQTREIFAGRTNQLYECLALAEHVGLHGILYGDRGVGKTSIANIVHLISTNFGEEGWRAMKIECSSSDTFENIVRGVYKQIEVALANDNVGFCNAPAPEQKVPLATLLPEKSSFNPKDVAYVLKQAAGRLLIILDEFDRLDGATFNLSSFTELLKIISDTGVDVHFLIVGVGESVDEIIGNHASIVRNLTQIKLGAMTVDEIREIIIKGIAKLELTMPAIVVEQIVSFSCGYPHYTHLLSLNACANAIRSNRDDVSQADLDFSISRALAKAQESTRNAYHAATMANRSNIYREVLQACGEAELDEYSTFVPKDLEKPLSRLLKRPMKVSQFGAHLINLCRPERGSILSSIGEKGRARYRFKDPLMRAYVRLTGATRIP